MLHSTARWPNIRSARDQLTAPNFSAMAYCDDRW